MASPNYRNIFHYCFWLLISLFTIFFIHQYNLTAADLLEYIINMLCVCWVLIRCSFLRLATIRMPWEKHGTPNLLCGAILMGYELWLFTLSSPSLSLLQRTTPLRCGTCKRLLLPKSKYSTPTHKSKPLKHYSSTACTKLPSIPVFLSQNEQL